ncbi:hypothetical protein CIL05_16005 [Virgibacillus profundi]|uniref:Uncharacterized protein n=1 Tax=Virgibacillus profundi TaxID=2024555 RepID=A0A2A2IA37_9BACI|nr:hypothetical protein [Virgibacillus profundi]PAV28442.1 hypothetical protein CIL05_16005 [Virgibacillus profundi]PXY52615.1 hypothetical protein CIT14_16145 [Virgibacillus profundi]
MLRISRWLGIVAGISSIFLWFILVFFNPYNGTFELEPFLNTLITLFLPACLAIGAAITNRKYFLLIAFLWSAPISAYMALTPGIFKFFGLTSALYLVSFLTRQLAGKAKEQ